MSLPRRIIPGTTYMLSRRCLERRFFLRPSDKVNQIVKFCLAVAASRTGVILHGFNFLSNHYHIVATDTDGKLPEFMHWLNEYVAKCVNVELGRWENFWAAGSYSAVELAESKDIVAKLIYVFANPVSSGLVGSLEEWPGAHSKPADMDRRAVRIARPKGFFREKGPVPASALLKVCLPARLDMNIPDLERLLREREQQLRDDATANRRRFLGRDRVLRQRPMDRPKNHEDRRGLNPRVAAIDKWRRIEALQRLNTFVAAYREAWLRFADGELGVVFPLGTYSMQIRFGVQCGAP